ncbi:hypothetical protein [Erythrobacter sp. HL-111]|uniref:hypothetical protein n=1 Tax=Erythrobacter sp. HL-111 TaxID=1798193 RepID=UPI0006D9F9D8|nr:hypothetical protein [Erythrobacter sp. HL-111]KPP88493.1 MAG: hypothetical protein HLUCCO15_11530 [Erythrobacteraceae bacterium HL-111]SDS20461.1 hypothetical protein SAMN04515621_1146 [Erythrobacter sp. HL-111]
MDLNELLHAHQVEVMKASASGDEKSRRVHFQKVAMYAECISDLRAMLGKDRGASKINQNATLVYGSYAGEQALFAAGTTDLAKWEDEGGSLNVGGASLPAGITVRIVREYHVGQYVYQDLRLAVAEFERQEGRSPLVNKADE